jgi:hypothetical protein
MHNSIDPSDRETREPPDRQTWAGGERLRSLPTETLPPYNWQEFQRRSREFRRAANDGIGWRPMAVAAALLLVVCAIAIWDRTGGGGGRYVVADSGAVEDGANFWKQGAAPFKHSAHDDTERLRGAQPLEDVSSTKNASSVDGADASAALRSRAIESWLASLPREPAVVRVGTRAAVAGLEDRIAQVDDLMTSVGIDGVRPDRLAALQQARLRLVGSLAQVRYAEVVESASP